jgi:hypothetical protein
MVEAKMADPTGTVGQTSGPASDLALATSGGPKFMERLQQLAAAADRLELAFAQFGFGQGAEAAVREATEQLDAANSDRAAAVVALADAKRDAAKTLADAATERAVARELRRTAEEQLSSVQDKEQQAIAAADAARQAGAKAAVAQRKAEAKEKELTGKLRRLQDELRAVM